MTNALMPEPATLESCPPRFGTKPDLKAPHKLAHYRALARGMGIKLMAWQELVLRTISEFEPDGTPRYQQAIITVPRQCGKSTMGTLLILERMLLHQMQPQLIAFSAQSLMEGIMFWSNQPVQKMLAGGLVESAGLRLYASVSNPHLKAESTGSQMRILAPNTESAGHAQTYGMAMIDEAWSLKDSKVERGLLATMRTIQDPLLIICSTVGTDASTYLRDKCDKGRAALISGTSPDTAFFEWSAPPDADIDDPEVWRKATPAWGYTVNQKTINREREIAPENDFRRMTLNQWVEADGDSAIPRGAWLESQGEAGDFKKNVVLTNPVFLAIDAPPERTRAMVVACDTRGRMEIAEWRNGTEWLPEWLAAAMLKSEIIGIAYAKGSSLSSLEPELEAARLPLRPIDANEFCHASGDFVEALVNGQIRVRPSRVFNVAVAGTVKWPRGDKWRIGRRDATCDVSPIVAAAMAFFTMRREAYAQPNKPGVINLADYLNGGPASDTINPDDEPEKQADRNDESEGDSPPIPAT